MSSSELAPQNLEAEKALLGELIAEPERFDDLPALSPNDFYLPSHAAVFEAFLALNREAEQIDVISIEERTKNHGREVSAAAIMELVEHRQPAVTTHARLIIEEARKRNLLAELSRFEKSIRARRGLDAEDLGRLRLALDAIGTDGEKESSSHRQPIMVRIADVVREQVSWLWDDRIPIGKLTMVEGDPGLGKSWLTLALAASISRGAVLPGCSLPVIGNTLLMSAEDGLGDTIRPRLEDLGANLDRIHSLRGFTNVDKREFSVTLDDLDVLERAIILEKPVLVIVDPIIAFINGADTSKANEVRGLLSPLAAMAEKHQCALIAIRHLNKSAARAFYRGQGSIDFIAACRSAFVVGEHPEDETERVFCHLKSNLAPKTSSLTFNLKGGRFNWTGETSLTAEQVLAIPAPAEDRTKHEEAKEFLNEVLTAGAVESTSIDKQARAAGISKITLRRAKDALGVVAKKSGFNGAWLWQLPTEGDHGRPEGDQHDQTSNHDHLGQQMSILGDGDTWEKL